MAQKFQVGDVVRLKSGGPNMTVSNYATYAYEANEPKYQCKWFDEKHKQSLALFREEELEIVNR
jgi:uncharacterized protein YodC (DUF2158 family)